MLFFLFASGTDGADLEPSHFYATVRHGAWK